MVRFSLLMLFSFYFFSANTLEPKDTLLCVHSISYLNDTIVEWENNTTYNEYGQQISSEFQQYKNGYKSSSMYQYDEQNRLSREYRFEDTTLTDSIIYTYNLDGSSEIVYWGFNTETVVKRVEFYNKKHQLLKDERLQTWQNKMDTMRWLTLYQYAETGRKSEVSSYLFEFGSYSAPQAIVGEIDTIDYSDSLRSRVRFIYDDKGQLIEERYYRINSVLTNITRFQYDENGFMIKDEDWNAATDATIVYSDCEYNEVSNCMSCVNHEFGTVIYLNYCYSDTGKMKYEIRFQLLSNGNRFSSERTYRYSDLGYLLEEYELITNGSTTPANITTYKTTYTYQAFQF